MKLRVVRRRWKAIVIRRNLPDGFLEGLLSKPREVIVTILATGAELLDGAGAQGLVQGSILGRKSRRGKCVLYFSFSLVREVRVRRAQLERICL